jgi:opacity protein-like surface antigen
MQQCRGIAVAAAWLVAMAGSAAAADSYYPQGAPAAEPYVQSGFYVRGDVGWSWFDWNEVFDSGNLMTFGAGIGWQLNPVFRTDVRFDHVIGQDSPNMDRIGTVTANGYIDVPLDLPFTPYVGAGIGYGFVTTSLDDEKGLAAALMGGLTFDVSKYVAVDAGYRFRTVATDDSIFADDNVRDHSATVGIRFKF